MLKCYSCYYNSAFRISKQPALFMGEPAHRISQGRGSHMFVGCVGLLYLSAILCVSTIYRYVQSPQECVYLLIYNVVIHAIVVTEHNDKLSGTVSVALQSNLILSAACSLMTPRSWPKIASLEVRKLHMRKSHV
jgi:hypothetical protein